MQTFEDDFCFGRGARRSKLILFKSADGNDAFVHNRVLKIFHCLSQHLGNRVHSRVLRIGGKPVLIVYRLEAIRGEIAETIKDGPTFVDFDTSQLVRSVHNIRVGPCINEPVGKRLRIIGGLLAPISRVVTVITHNQKVRKLPTVTDVSQNVSHIVGIGFEAMPDVFGSFVCQAGEHQ
ncbi:hypothetical protein AB7M49_004088 [Bradyrhizobium elkanii]